MGTNQDYYFRGKPKPHLQGENNLRSKLTRSLVHYILISPKTNLELAREVGVCFSTISDVRNGRTWASVPRPKRTEAMKLEAIKHRNMLKRKVLLEEDVINIKRRLAVGKRGIVSYLAKVYGVSHQTISDIKHGRVWTHVIVDEKQ